MNPSAVALSELPPDVVKSLEDKIAHDVATKTQGQIDQARKGAIGIVLAGLVLVYLLTRKKR